MASITPRVQKDGSKKYLAQITRRKQGFQESKTLGSRAAAEAWARTREKEIDLAIELGQPLRKKSSRKVKLSDAIDRYLEESMKEIGTTKSQVLNTIKNEYRIATMSCEEIGSPDIVAFVKELHDRPDLNSKSTALNYLSHLSGVFSIARPMWGFQLDEKAMRDAQKVCTVMGLVAKSEERDRRPTLQELEALMDHFESAHQIEPRKVPMHKVLAFAIFSTRRQAEICRIERNDIDRESGRILVKKMKNPGDKGGLDTWVELDPIAIKIIDAFPSKPNERRIFPFNPDTISSRFTRACQYLGIEDLRFHDMRHEGTSRLAEMGRTVPQLASVTGHRSWKSLERYTHVRQVGDKYEGWKWIQKVT